MIVVGIALLIIAWAVPQVVPDVPPGVINICHVLGVIAVVVGLILLLWGSMRDGTHPIGGRRRYYTAEATFAVGSWTDPLIVAVLNETARPMVAW
ncbi:MAG: hypothetical protein QOD58_3601, partial [Mycobacterium sp.]|nr:hypothetical protein [Mycobacterium sp.]